MSEPGDQSEEQMRNERRAKMEAAKDEEQQLKMALRTVLDEKAYGRIMNVRISNASLFSQAAQVSISLYKRAGRKLTEDEVVAILMRIKSQAEHKTRITFDRK